MAQTPQTNDAFIREVSDEVRRERMEHAARRYGLVVGAIVLLALIAFGAVLAWRSHRDSVAGEQGERLTAALGDLSSGKEADARKSLGALASTDTKGYAPLARITLADAMIKDGKDADAAAAFLKISSDGAVPQQLRDLALVRATALDFDKITPQVAIDRLKPLAVPGNPWFGSAGEMSGIAYLNLNQPKQAGAMFVAVTKDPHVPRSIKARVAQLAGNLGFQVVQPADSAES